MNGFFDDIPRLIVKPGEVRERRRYERLYERNSSVSAMTPRSLNTFIPGLLEMQDALYPGLPSIGVTVYLTGWIRMRDVVRRTIFRLRVWIRRTLRRFARLPLLVINPDGQIFGLAIPRLYRHRAGDSTLIVQI